MLRRIFLARNIIPKVLEVCQDGFLASENFSFSLFSTRSKTLLAEEKVSSLLEVYKPKKGRKRLTLDETQTALQFFLDQGFAYAEIYRCVQVYPSILRLDVAKADALFEALTQIGFSRKDIITLILKLPGVIRSNAINVVKLYKYFNEGLSMNQKEFVEMLMKRPALLSLLVEENIVQTCQYFSQELEFDNESLTKMLLHSPTILASSIEKKIKPIINYFLNDLALPLHRVKAKLKQRPSIVNSSVAGIKERVQWMKDSLKFSDEDISKAFTSELTIFYYSIPIMEKKINNLSLQFNCSTEECKAIIISMPQILGLNEEYLNTKIKYLTREMNRSIHEIVKCPAVLGLSLEKRIKVRCEKLEENKIRQNEFPLWKLFLVSEERFHTFIEKHKPKEVQIQAIN